MALIYGASAAAVQSATTTQSATTAESASTLAVIAGCQPWCKMNVPQRAWCLKSHVTKYVKDRIRFYYSYKKAWWTQHYRAVRNAPAYKRLYLLNKYRKQWKGAKANWKRGDRKRRDMMYAKVKLLKRTNCSTVTKPVKVSQTCDGSLQRMWNEQTANLFEIAKSTPGKYTDVSFPADSTSVYWLNSQQRLSSKVFAAQMRKKTYNKPNDWKRVRDLNKIPGGVIWGSKGVRPDGVRQGDLGDCWWLATTTALAENPERIKKLFTNMDVEKGIYEFEFFSQGKANKIVIDDKVLMRDEAVNGVTAFGKESPHGAWWLPLLEKGYAKFLGTYENMNGGWGDAAFQAFTGYPTEWFRHTIGAAALFEVVKNADANNHVMWVEPVKNQIGLYTNHQYGFISHINWRGKDFVQIREPMAWFEYTGAWSDTDTRTNANELAAFRAHVKALKKHDQVGNDGKFWMEFKDFHKYFLYTTVGYYLEDFHYSSFQTSLVQAPNHVQSAPAYTYYTLKNPVKQHLYLAADPISFYQFMDKKCEDEKKTKSEKANRAVEFNMAGQDWWIDQWTDNGWAQDTFKQWKELPAGEYKIRANTKFRGESAGTFPFGLIAHASKQKVSIGL